MTAVVVTLAASSGTSETASSGTSEAASKHTTHIPDLNGHRYCRYCRALRPLSAFPSGKRRYICRRHVWQCIKKVHQTRVLADAHRKMLFKQWQRCYVDAKTFQHARIDVTQEDLGKLLKETLLKRTACAAQAIDGLDTGLCVAVMPRDPRHTLCCDNAVVVSNEARRVLLRVHRRRGAEAYVMALARCIDATH